MRFLNPLLLFGAAAFAIPLIIHILNKRRFREVHWGAVHLLHQVVKKNNRRLRIEQLILLLLRIGIPIILALLMAKPVLTRSIKWLEDQRVSTLFLIDDSYSMQVGTADQSNFAAAKETVAQISENLADGSDAAALLIGGTRPQNLLDDPTTGLSEFVERVNEVNANGDPAGIAQALQASLGELEQMDNVAREVVVVSDFQARDWSSSSAAVQRQSALDALASSEVPVNLTLVKVGDRQVNEVENLAVTSVVTSKPVVGVNQKIVLRATIENFGKQSFPDLEVKCRIDGRPHRATRVTVGPQQKAQALFTHTFTEAGTHTVEVTLEPDRLEADNQYMTVVSVWDNLPTLLLVNRENVNAPPLQGDADFVELALQPHGSASSNPTELKDLIVTRKMSSDQANERVYDETRVVVMTNINRLHGGSKRLREFVERGGGLLIFPGGDTDVKWFNGELFQNGDGLLPLPIQRAEGTGVPGASAERASLKSEVFEHPALSFFNDPRNGNLSRATWTRWLKLGLDESAPAEVQKKVAGSTSVLARLGNGDPLFVEKKYGDGRVIMAAVPANAEWGNLPTNPFFVPLMQRMITYLAATVAPPRNLAPGDRIVHFVPQDQQGRKLRLLDPAGGDHELEVKRSQRRGMIEYADTREPGLYELMAPNQRVEHYVVNLSRTESDLKRLDSEELAKLGEEMDAQVANGWEEYLLLDRERRQGTGIWRPLLWLVLLFLFGEVLFQQWMRKRKLV